MASGAAGQSGPLARYNCGSGGARRVSLGQDSGRFPFSIKFGNPVPAGSIASVWKRERVQLHACSCMRACTQLVHYCCCGCSLPLLAATAAVPRLVAAVSAVATCSVLADVQCSPCWWPLVRWCCQYPYYTFCLCSTCSDNALRCVAALPMKLASALASARVCWLGKCEQLLASTCGACCWPRARSCAVMLKVSLD